MSDQYKMSLTVNKLSHFYSRKKSESHKIRENDVFLQQSIHVVSIKLRYFKRKLHW